jgi:hypothetical protein
MERAQCETNKAGAERGEETNREGRSGETNREERPGETRREERKGRSNNLTPQNVMNMKSSTTVEMIPVR